MNRSTYNVDDILEEVKRKRAREASMGSAPPAQQPPAPYPGYGGTPAAYRAEGAPAAAGQRGDWTPAPEHSYPQPEYPGQYAPERREPERYMPPSPQPSPYAAPASPDRGYGFGADPAFSQQPPPRRGGGFAPEASAYPPRGYEQPADPAGYYPAPAEGPYAPAYGQHQSGGFSFEGNFPAQGFGAPAIPQAPTPPLTVNRRTPKPSMDELLQNFGEGVGLGKGLDPSKPAITPRRSAPIVGSDPAQQQPAARSYPRFDYPSSSYPAPARQSAPGGYPASPAGFSPQVRDGGYAAPAHSPTPRFQMEPSYERERYPAGGYPAARQPDPGYTAYPAQSPADHFSGSPLAAANPPGMPEQSPEAFSANPPVQGQAFESRWNDTAAQTAVSPEPAAPAPEPAAFREPAFKEPAFKEPAYQEPAFKEPVFPEPAPFTPPPEEPEGPMVPEAAYTPPFEQEATRSTEIDDSLRSATVSHISLAPEDTQDDVDVDENGRTLDASSGESEQQEILQEVRHTRIHLLARFGVTAAAFALLLFLALAYMYPSVPTPPFMWAEGETMRTFLCVNLVVLVLAMLVNYPTIGGGLVSLFTFKADNDSLLALATVAAVSQGVALIVTPEAADLTTGVHLYFCIPVLGLCFNLFGRLMTTRRIALGSRIVCGEGDKYVMRTIKSEDFSRQLSRGLPADLPEITYSVKTRYVSGFLQACYAQDYAESINRVLALICLGASAAVSAASYFISETHSIYLALTVFSALLCVCAPFTATIVGNAPMLRAARKLQKSGAVIAGYPVVEEYNEVKAATFKAKELFPEESIILSSMKVFQESLIEQAILDAASVICATDSPLSPIFRGMINANEKILKPVENIVYEDAMGLSAWVSGKRVLIGNAQLMANHGIATPSRDYEHRYVGEGKQILYLSNSGELIAMFALSYTADMRVAEQLKELEAGGVSLIIHSTDPNITPMRIAELYHYPQQYVKIVPANLHADYNRIIAPRGRARASIIYSGTIMSMFRALGIIPRIKSAVTSGTACQLLATLIGYAVITFFAFFAGMAHIPFTLLLIYQLVWAAAVCIIVAARRI